jgi:hypothetical protein
MFTNHRQRRVFISASALFLCVQPVLLFAPSPPEVIASMRPLSEWPEYATNPFSFPVSEKVSKDQFFVVDLNGDGLMDFTFRSETKLYAYDHYGSQLWNVAIDNPRTDITAGSHDGTGHAAADVDGNGQVEILALNRANQIKIYNGTNGNLERTISLPTIGSRNKWVYIAVANLRGAGDRDVIVQTMDTSGSQKGVYINRNLLGWDLENNRELWRVVQDDSHANGIYEGYWGVAHGSFQAADVDGDGRDEVVGGNMIDHDGTVINLGYPTNWIGTNPDGYTDHLDAITIGDFRPDLPGLEWIVTEEGLSNGTGWNTTLLSTSGILWRKQTSLFNGSGREPQNVAAGNFDTDRTYSEVWNRSRFSGPTDSQHPWVYNNSGSQFADYAMEDVLPAGFNTHEYGNKEGVEEISTIDWFGGTKDYLVAKARHVNGNIGVFDAVSGAAIWYTPRDFSQTFASIIYAADISGDSREEVIICDTLGSGSIKVYWNAATNPNPPKLRKWDFPLYRRLKQNWNYYSPGGHIDNTPVTLTVISPNGGESWVVGSTQNITWSGPESVTNVKIEYSVDNGGSWTTIITSTPNDGSHSWTIPNAVSNQCLIRISDAADGNPADVSDGIFAIVPSPPIPTIASFTPASGPVGTVVTITGSNFTGATNVSFNGVATAFNVNSDTEIQATVPADATTGKISVTNAFGTGTSANDFIVTAPPSLTSFIPTSGPVGTQVTINGTNFTGASSVTFNGFSANFTVNSDTQIRATVPADATTGKIGVANSAGSALSAEDFTVTIAPSVFTFTPSHDTYVKLSSPTSSYGSATTLRQRVTSSDALRTYLKFNLTGVTGTVASAKLRLYVTDASNDGGSVYLVSNDYTGTTTPWTESGLKWSNAPAIEGAALRSAGAVALNNWVELDVTSAIVGNGTYSFGLKNNSSDVVSYSSKEGANAPQLIIQAISGSPMTPVITSFTPTSGAVGTVVTIFGSNFFGTTNVTFNGTIATFTVISNTELRATVPEGATTGKISITNTFGAGTSATDFVVTTGGGSTTVTFTPTDDAYVRSSSPTSNTGSANELRVRKTSSVEINSYLKFNVAGLSRSVQSAKLRLYVIDASPDGGALYLVSNEYRGSTTAWTETGIVWNNAPEMTGSPLSTVGSVSVGQTVEFDVTSAITGNGIYSFGLKNNASDVLKYSSKEGANAPQLVIQTNSSSSSALKSGELAELENEKAVTPFPENIVLYPNHPNPFNAQTKMEYALPAATPVRLVIFDITGRLVRHLIDGMQEAGYKRVLWDGRDEQGVVVSSGIYLFRLELGNKALTRKMSVIK